MELVSFVQNLHDHPLYLIYQGEGCWEATAVLAAIFHEDSHQLDADNLTGAMIEAATLHSLYRETDYLFYCKIKHTDGGAMVVLAFNHRFHDVTSASAVLRGYKGTDPLRTKCNQIAGCIKRVQQPLEFRAMVPVKISTVHFSHDQLAAHCALHRLTSNEFIFYHVNTLIAKVIHRPYGMMNLHTMRKTLRADRNTLGDFSCFARALCITGPPTPVDVQAYFERIRDGTWVLREDSQEHLQGELWNYNSWIGTGAGRMEDHWNMQLDSDSLMHSLRMFVDKYVMAVDRRDGVDVYIFSDEVSL